MKPKVTALMRVFPRSWAPALRAQHQITTQPSSRATASSASASASTLGSPSRFFRRT